tara:strand:+ start:116 stop:337 length:222 start_codon:yes stop_codon:yes gene_type:complete
MIKFIFTLILILSFSFASQETNQETVEADQYYASLNQEEEVLSADYGKKKNKGPLRKRYLKRKRKVRNPAQGK